MPATPRRRPQGRQRCLPRVSIVSTSFFLPTRHVNHSRIALFGCFVRSCLFHGAAPMAPAASARDALEQQETTHKLDEFATDIFYSASGGDSAPSGPIHIIPCSRGWRCLTLVLICPFPDEMQRRVCPLYCIHISYLVTAGRTLELNKWNRNTPGPIRPPPGKGRQHDRECGILLPAKLNGTAPCESSGDNRRRAE